MIFCKLRYSKRYGNRYHFIPYLKEVSCLWLHVAQKSLSLSGHTPNRFADFFYCACRVLFCFLIVDERMGCSNQPVEYYYIIITSYLSY